MRPHPFRHEIPLVLYVTDFEVTSSEFLKIEGKESTGKLEAHSVHPCGQSFQARFEEGVRGRSYARVWHSILREGIFWDVPPVLRPGAWWSLFLFLFFLLLLLLFLIFVTSKMEHRDASQFRVWSAPNASLD